MPDLPSNRERLRDARLYLCTDGRRERGDLPEFLDAVLASGVDVVQLREKNLEAREELRLLEVFAAACHRHGRLLAVNDRADVAHVARPHVLHLGQDDLPPSAARAVLRQRSPRGAGEDEEILLGRSTHAPDEVDAAAEDPDSAYFCVGPCWPTPTKPGRPAPGLDLVRYAATRGSNKPWFAIGGVQADTLDQVLDAGARRVVVVRAITEAADPAAATAALTERLRQRPVTG